MMTSWTLYEGPTNHDKRWVVRLFRDELPTNIYFEADTRKECEDHVFHQYPDGHWIPRLPADDPCIVGVWI